MNEINEWNEESHLLFSRTSPCLISDIELSLWSQPEAAPEDFPFRSQWLANQLTNRVFRRQRRDGGIVEECCVFKGCTFSELSEYCADR
jgi:hypothetical protein